LTAEQTVSAALQADQVFEKVFRQKLEKPDLDICYESLWTGFADMILEKD